MKTKIHINQTKYMETKQHFRTLEHSGAHSDEYGVTLEEGSRHLLVDVPDGSSSVSLRTSEGKRIRLCFHPYEKGGPPQCMDVLRRDPGAGTMNLGPDNTPCPPVPTHDVKVMSGGFDLLDTQQGNLPATVTCIILKDL